MRWGCDVDGVLAKFDPGFLVVLNRLSGKSLQLPDKEPHDWYWPTTELGFSKKEVDNAWRWVDDNPWFWAQLHAYETAGHDLSRLEQLSAQGHLVYFITQRSPDGAKVWTEHWLRTHGISHPTVLISGIKGPVAEGLELDVMVDDRPENLADIIAASPKTRVYLVRRPWNEKYVFPNVVTSVSEALDAERLLDPSCFALKCPDFISK